jgi:hypothetical protein
LRDAARSALKAENPRITEFCTSGREIAARRAAK